MDAEGLLLALPEDLGLDLVGTVSDEPQGDRHALGAVPAGAVGHVDDVVPGDQRRAGDLAAPQVGQDLAVGGADDLAPRGRDDPRAVGQRRGGVALPAAGVALGQLPQHLARALAQAGQPVVLLHDEHLAQQQRRGGLRQLVQLAALRIPEVAHPDPPPRQVVAGHLPLAHRHEHVPAVACRRRPREARPAVEVRVGQHAVLLPQLVADGLGDGLDRAAQRRGVFLAGFVGLHRLDDPDGLGQTLLRPVHPAGKPQRRRAIEDAPNRRQPPAQVRLRHPLDAVAAEPVVVAQQRGRDPVHAVADVAQGGELLGCLLRQPLGLERVQVRLPQDLPRVGVGADEEARVRRGEDTPADHDRLGVGVARHLGLPDDVPAPVVGEDPEALPLFRAADGAGQRHLLRRALRPLPHRRGAGEGARAVPAPADGALGGRIEVLVAEGHAGRGGPGSGGTRRRQRQDPKAGSHGILLNRRAAPAPAARTTRRRFPRRPTGRRLRTPAPSGPASRG